MKGTNFKAALSALALAGVVAMVFPAAAQQWPELSPVEKIYADLAKLPADERAKRIEEGAKKEGTFILVHTLRGELGNGHINLFRKRYPFLKVEATADIGSQDAAERLYAEETSGRHLTDVIGIVALFTIIVIVIVVVTASRFEIFRIVVGVVLQVCR